MKHASLNQNSFVVRLELGEDIHDAIHEFCTSVGINNASIEGIGSVNSPTLAHYSIETKQFTNKQFEGIFEVTSLVGNIALVDNQPFAHIHVNISDREMNVSGGHLVKGKCSATLELIITKFSSDHQKKQDDAIGLKVWDL